jgi:hypothetical protein
MSHAMWGALQNSDGTNRELSEPEANALSNLWIRTVWSAAQISRQADDGEMFNFLTGVGLHWAQDATSPQHRDSDGNLQRWSGEENLGQEIAHVVPEIPYPGDQSHLDVAARITYGWFNQGYLPSGDLLGIFGVDTPRQQFSLTPDEARELNQQRMNYEGMRNQIGPST